MTDPKQPLTTLRALPGVRDAFLDALDGDERARTNRLARDLVDCIDVLPGLTRLSLGLPEGATYGAAARHILALDTERNAPGSPARTDIG